MLQVEGSLKTGPGPGSICRKVNPSLRCRETMQFRSRYQTSQTPCCAFPLGDYAGQHRLEQRSLCAHSDPPEDHPDQCEKGCAQKNKRRRCRGDEKREQGNIAAEFVE